MHGACALASEKDVIVGRRVERPTPLLNFLSAGVPHDADPETLLCVRSVNALALLSAFGHFAAFLAYAMVLQRWSLEALAHALANMAVFGVSALGRWRIARLGLLAATAYFVVEVYRGVAPGWGGEFIAPLFLSLPMSVLRRSERIASIALFLAFLATFVWVLVLMQRNPAPFATAEASFWPNYYITLGVFSAILLGSLAVFRASLLRVNDKAVEERDKTDRLIDNILPKTVANRLRAGEPRVADSRNDTTIVFIDLVGFTSMTEKVSPAQLVDLLDGIFRRLDEAAARHGVEKIKTIGDAYLAAAGVTTPATPQDVMACAAFALEAKQAIPEISRAAGFALEARIGIHSGPVVAGVLGQAKTIFDVWGSAVNLAARLQTSAEPNEIRVSQHTYERIKAGFALESVGALNLKGLGERPAFRLVGAHGGVAAE